MPLGEVIFSEPHRCVSEGRHGLQPAAVAPDRHNPGSSGESGSLEGEPVRVFRRLWSVPDRFKQPIGNQ